MTTLTPFEGRDVLRSTIAITNAGDGLSDAMKVEPTEFHHGDRVYVVLECEVAKVHFPPFDKADPMGPLSRVHTLKAGTATIVDADLVQEQVQAMAERVLAAKEAEAGIVRLFDGDGDDTTDENGDPTDAELEALEGDLEAKETPAADPAAEGEPAPAGADWDEGPPPGTTTAAARKRAGSKAKTT